MFIIQNVYTVANKLFFLFQLVMLFVILDFKRSSYKEYVYPLGWDLLGWGFTVIPILCVPIVALYRVLTWHRHMTFKEVCIFPIHVTLHKLCFQIVFKLFCNKIKIISCTQKSIS